MHLQGASKCLLLTNFEYRSFVIQVYKIVHYLIDIDRDFVLILF